MSSGDLDSQPTGTACWIEIPALDVDRAMKFYKAVFPTWDYHEITGPDCGYRYVTFHGGPEASEQPYAGGALYSVESAENIASKSAVVVYFNVRTSDVDKTVQAITDTGGSFVSEFENVGENGRVRKFKDCEGNILALYAKRTTE